MIFHVCRFPTVSVVSMVLCREISRDLDRDIIEFEIIFKKKRRYYWTYLGLTIYLTHNPQWLFHSHIPNPTPPLTAGYTLAWIIPPLSTSTLRWYLCQSPWVMSGIPLYAEYLFSYPEMGCCWWVKLATRASNAVYRRECIELWLVFTLT